MGGIEETVEAYEDDAERYVQKLEFPTPEEELDRFTDLLRGEKVLDAGCGAGRDAKYLESKGIKVIGIDLSEKMLKKARERSNAQFKLMDIRETSFPDQSFHGVWCHNVVLHLAKEGLERNIEEFNRILKEKGALHISAKLGKGKESKESEKPTKTFFLYQEQQLKNILTEKGFKVVSANKERHGEERFINILLEKCSA